MHLKLIDLIGRLILRRLILGLGLALALSLNLALCLSSCESKPQLPKLSAWQTCEYMMGLWFNHRILADEKFLAVEKLFYHSKFLDQLQQMPNFSKISKKKKAVWQISNSNDQVEDQSNCTCHYVYLAQEVPLVLEIQMKQVKIDGQDEAIWQLDHLINGKQQESLIALLLEDHLLSISQNQTEINGLNGIDRQYKAHASVMIAWLEDMILVDGIQVDPKIENALIHQIEQAFAWREASAKAVQSRYQRKLSFAIDQSADIENLALFFKTAYLTKSEGISLVVKNPYQKLTTMHMSTPSIEGKANANLGEIDLKYSVIVQIQASQIDFEYRLANQKEIKHLSLPLSEQGELPIEILIQKIDEIRTKIANEMHQLGFLISMQNLKSIKSVLTLMEKLYSIDEAFLITIDLRTSTP
jgi:hypothetical protein